MPAEFPDGELDDAVELGAVDSRSVRVWLRSRHTPMLSATLAVDGHAAVTACVDLSEETDWTGAVVLSLAEDAPGAAFTCSVGDHRSRGRLAPAPREHGRVVFGFGSCHRPFTVVADDAIERSPVAGLYPAMRRDLLRREADLLLLAGDQVYSDEVAPVSVRAGLSGDEDHPPPPGELLEAYRRVSRGFLGEAGVGGCARAFPTYLIWDDHDIFNCWGSRLSKSPLDRAMFAAATRAYGEYQHTRNPGGRIGPPPFDYTFRRGDVGFLVLDIRGCRDFEQHHLIGAEQWARVQAYLSGPDAATLQTLFVVSSIPVAHVSRWLAALFDRLPGSEGNAVRDRWCSSAFVDSRDALLDALLTWQTAEPFRQVCILSGDVHCASAFTIRPRTGPGRIQQFTSSALTTPDPWTQRTANRVAVRMPNLFEPRFRFKRHLLTFQNNYGLVAAEPLPTGGHRITFTVRAWQRSRRGVATVGRVIVSPDGR